MHKFIININRCINMDKYGMFFYPFFSKGYQYSDTVHVIEVGSLEKVYEARDAIKTYLSLHASAPVIQVFFCATLYEDEPRNTSLYFDILSYYFKEGILADFPLTEIQFSTFIIAPSDYTTAALHQPDPEAGWRKTAKTIFPDLSNYLENSFPEREIPGICTCLLNDIKDTAAKRVYSTLFNNIIKESESAVSGEAEMPQFVPFRTSEEYLEEEDGKLIAEKCDAPDTVNFEARFKKHFTQFWLDSGICHTQINYVESRDNNISDILKFVAFVTQFEEPDFNRFLKNYNEDAVADAINKYKAVLSSAKNGLKNIPLFDTGKKYRIRSPGRVDESAKTNIALDEPLSNLNNWFDENIEASFISKSQWESQNQAIKEKILGAEETIKRFAQDMVLHFNSNRFIYNDVDLTIEELFGTGEGNKGLQKKIEEQKRKLEIKKADLEEQLFLNENDNLDYYRQIKMMNIQSDTETKITFWIDQLNRARPLLFLLTFLFSMLLVIVPYALLQGYLLSKSGGSIYWVSYVGLVGLMYFPSYFILRLLLKRAIKKKLKTFAEEYSDYVENYKSAAKKFNQRLNTILELFETEDKLAAIYDYDKQIVENNAPKEWHNTRLSKLIDGAKYFDDFTKNALEDQSADITAVIDIHRSEWENPAYSIVLDDTGEMEDRQYD